MEISNETLRRLLNKVNKVTAYHRHGNVIPKAALDELANAQLDYEQSLTALQAQATQAQELDMGHDKPKEPK